jgi:hypothetical protein
MELTTPGPGWRDMGADHLLPLRGPARRAEIITEQAA